MTTSTDPARPLPRSPIPAPPEFPVVWGHPSDERLFWTRHRMHYPAPVPAVTGAFVASIMEPGFKHAAERYGLPIRNRFQRINGYIYNAACPLEPAAEAEPIESVITTLGARWSEEWLPEIRRIVAELAAFDLATTPTPALIERFDEMLRLEGRLGEIHFLVGIPPHVAQQSFIELYQELFEGAEPFEALRLVQGEQTSSVRANAALWKLAQQARALPGVREIFETAEAGDIIPVLSGVAGARDLLAALATYLAEYGERGSTFDSIGEPSWLEDPTPLVVMLKEYVAQLGQETRDPAAELAALVAERERLIAAAHAQLAGYPAAVRARFETLRKAARAAVIISDDHNYWIDQRGFYQLRRVLLEFGRRFVAAGVLEQPEDIVHLTFDETRVTAASLPRLDRRALVRERREELTRFAALTPPPALGTLPPGPPPDNLMGRAVGGFFGTPVAQSDDPRELRGHAGSAGSVTGPARVIHSLAEAGRLKPGEILVTETTAPPWTPLFATAAAIVTDTGGILSHCAIVAREYRLPAVVGAQVATTRIRDGQILEVDGSLGIVRMLDGR